MTIELERFEPSRPLSGRIVDRAGAPDASAAVAREVTEANRILAALRESEERYRNLAEHGPDAVVLHCEGTIVYANPQAAALVGAQSPDDVVGLSILDFVHPDDRPLIMSQVTRAIDHGDPVVRTELRVRRLDGTCIDGEVTSLPTTHEGKPAVQVVVRDITERKRWEATLTELAAIVQSSEDSIVSTDLDGRVRTWNRGAEAVYGYEAREVIGRPISIVVPADRAPEFARIMATIRSGRPVERFETVGVRKDGELRDVALTISPLMDRSGTVVGASAIARDITDSKRVQRRLQTSQQERARLLQRVVKASEQERALLAAELHDGPVQHLTALDYRLASALRTLGAPTSPASQAIEHAQGLLREEIAGLRQMMRALRPPVLDEHGLEAALSEHLRLIQQTEPLRCSIDSTIPHRLSAEVETILYRVAQEALTNVVKHARASSARVALSSNESRVTLTVADDGVGFDPDRWANAGPQECLGLISMRERIQMAGGTWNLRSSPGSGTEIRAILPLDLSG